jgi:hypothetical protein
MSQLGAVVAQKSYQERLQHCLREAEETAKKETLSNVVALYESELANSKTGRLKRGKMAEIIKSVGAEQCIKPYMVFYEVKRLKRLERTKNLHIQIELPECNFPTETEEMNNLSSITTGTSTSTSLSTSTSTSNQNSDKISSISSKTASKKLSSEKKALKMKLTAAAYNATVQYKADLELARSRGKNLNHGHLSSIIQQKVIEQGLDATDANSISKYTIRNRVRNGGFLHGISSSNQSPMMFVEGHLVQFCIQLNRMSQTIDKKTFLNLANDLIKGTIIEKQMRE